MGRSMRTTTTTLRMVWVVKHSKASLKHAALHAEIGWELCNNCLMIRSAPCNMEQIAQKPLLCMSSSNNQLWIGSIQLWNGSSQPWMNNNQLWMSRRQQWMSSSSKRRNWASMSKESMSKESERGRRVQLCTSPRCNFNLPPWKTTQAFKDAGL